MWNIIFLKMTPTLNDVDVDVSVPNVIANPNVHVPNVIVNPDPDADATRATGEDHKGFLTDLDD